MALLEWKPAPWSIPTELELEAAERLLSHRPSDTRKHGIGAIFTYWDFSACDIAINALSRLNNHTFKNIRSISLHEDTPAVCMPQCHVEGLIPLWARSPRLQVQRQVRYYDAAFLSQLTLQSTSVAAGIWRLRMREPLYHLESLLNWLAEAQKMFLTHHLRKDAYTLIFEEKGNNKMWHLLGNAVRMQVAMNKSYEAQNLPLPLGLFPKCQEFRYWAPSTLPAWLPDLFRETVRGGGGRIRYKGRLMADWERELDVVVVDTEKTLEKWMAEWFALVRGIM